MTQQGRILVAVKQAVKHPCAWPGGYPLFVLMDDGEGLCTACAGKELGRIATSTSQQSHDGWQAVGVDVNWEDKLKED